MSRARSTEPAVDVFLRRVRRRAWLVYGLRALALGAGACSIVTVLAAMIAGPLVSALGAGASWALAAAALLLAAALAARPLAGLSGGGASRLLGAVDRALPSRARSALELTPSTGASAELIGAHAREVARRVSAISVRQVVPWSWLRHRTTALGAAGLVVSLSLAAGSERVRAGTWGLLHPARVDADGVRTASVISSMQVRLVFPSYLAREPQVVVDVTRLEVPRGTSVQLTVQPRVDIEGGKLRVEQREIRMQLEGEKLTGRFVARSDSPLEILVRADGRWFKDAARREVVVLQDASPRVTIDAPEDGAIVAHEAPMSVRCAASDDVGVESVRLAVRLADGSETRQRIWAHDASDDSRAQVAARSTVVPARLGARAGDEFSLWCEAADADVVAGPNVGRSPPITVAVASRARHQLRYGEQLDAALRQGLSLLGDRLETPLPSGVAAARQRFEGIERKTRRWLEALDDVTEKIAPHQDELGADIGEWRALHERHRRLLAREARLYRRGQAPHAQRQAMEDKNVTELERSVLWLADTLGSAHIEEARAIAHELQQLKDRVEDLLSQLGDNPSPQDREQLLGEVARLEQRIRDLAHSMQRLSRRVPGEFVNADALEKDATADNLGALRQAVNDGDLDEAARRLDQLGSQIDGLASALESGSLQFAEARYGARMKARQKALDGVADLAREQQALAQRTRDVIGRATRDAMRQGTGNTSRMLERQAEDVRRMLDQMDGRTTGQFGQDLLQRARDRARDTSEALGTGDLAEAERMSRAAERALRSLSHDLGVEAGMFPGHQGQTADDARKASGALDKLSRLREELRRATPDVASHMTPEERSRLEGAAAEQGSTARKAARMAERWDDTNNEDPMVPAQVPDMRQAIASMKEAEKALEAADPQRAQQAQDQAAQQLREVRDELRSQRDQEGTRQGRRRGGRAVARFDGPVDIPSADEFEAPAELRRRVLDAMREQTPSGYEAAVRRYYEEMLR